ncbi:hypothetical protein Glove_428g91 [Diversispora epigaea]|uniref:RNA helicase n=1 Tax=Diversispora epigaea TaxID=1348612 RepID=A0A397GXW8_9GLOM|nr:hypothetical protein Glove_428g91 [Diversispora epigaea]
MGKKKKATNSVRGFATTSTPSKAKDVTPNELLDKENPKKAKIDSENTSTKIVTDSTIISEDIESQRYIEKLRDLNSIKVEAYFEETEKTKNRVDKLPVLKLDVNIEQAVIKHIKKIGYQEQVNDKIDGKADREQVLVKLDIIYLILKRLGFLKRDVETCIRKICSLELQSALDWLCINVSSESLPIGFADKLYHEDETDITFVRTSSSSWQPPVGKTEPPTQNLSIQKTNIPNRDVPRSTKSTKSAILDEKLKSLTLNALENINSDSEEENDPNMKYAVLKYELMGKSTILKKLEKSKKDNKTKCDLILNQINQLNSQIKLIEQNYLFSKKTADNIYKKKIKKNDFKEFDLDSDDEEEEEIEKKEDKDDIDDHENFLGFSIKDEEDGDLFGGLLDIPISTSDDNNNVNSMEVETTDTTNSTSCALRDMPVPPSWTGQLPKDMLQEFCRKIDSKALVTFSKEPTIGGNSIMKAKVIISWSNGKLNTFIMKGEGCRTFEEAKDYVSTLALFELTNLPLYMALPPSYSDLWKELIQTKNIAANKNTIATEEERMKFLLSIVDNKVKEVMKIQEVTKGDTVSQESNMMPTKFVPISKDIKISDEGKAIKKAFENRQLNKPYKDLLNVRKKLPMYSYREELLKELNKNQVVIVSGETGCGKSTQVPQFIAEHMIMNELGDHCNILCTQPRRISAISIAHRVSLEMGDAPGTTGSTKSLVGYQIRLESRISRSNVMTFCTNGILLRRLEGDGLLNGVSHVIVDEVHERTLEIDFLLIILKNLLQKRHDLKVILMSATIEAKKLSSHFSGCPLVEVPGRTFPVAIKYLEDVVEETEYMINEGDEYARKIYRKIKDEGTITIGRGDSSQKLNYELEEDRDMNDDFEFPDEELLSSYSQRTRLVLRSIDHDKINYDLILSLLRYICISKDNKSLNTEVPPDGAILIFLPGMPEIIKLYDLLTCDRHFEDETRFLVFPLHSLISSENQGRVFEIPPEGVRKIVLATNIAETGITISDVTIVIDTGKVNLVRYNKQKRITTLEETFVAKANARQRRGRAGRIREGICFHLFTKWKHDYNMLDYEPPEILRLPLQELCLKIKICGMGDISDVLGMAIDPPTPQAIEDAISSLQEVQALTPEQQLTPLGIHLSHIPVDVHIGKMLLFGSIFRCLDPILTIAAILSYKSPFITPFGRESEFNAARKKFENHNSDLLTMYKAYCEWKSNYGKSSPIMGEFCQKNFLSDQNLRMIDDLKKQYLSLLVNIGFVHINDRMKVELSRSSYKRSLCIVPESYNVNSTFTPIINAAIVAGLYPKVIHRDIQMNQFINRDQKAVYIHPSSINYPLQNAKKPNKDWFVYNTMIQTKKLYVRDTSLVEVVDLVLFGRETEVKHEIKLLTIDKWIKLQCFAKTATLLKYLREQLNKILKYKIDHPEAELEQEQEEWLNLILGVIKSCEIDSSPGRVSV